MSTLASFPITRKWPARQPDRLQLYPLRTSGFLLPNPNGPAVIRGLAIPAAA